MKAKLILLLVGVVFGSTAFGQTIRGKVTSEDGEEMFGATVTFKNHPNIGTSTDFDGSYSLKVPTTEACTLVVSNLGFTTVEFPFVPGDQKVIVQNFTLKTTTEEVEEVVVTVQANKSGDDYLEQKQISSATSISFMSGEKMKKLGDSKVDDAVKRVTGVSTVGSFITVRGLADRYVKTTVNGSQIPTLDPFTNNIRLDMFPTGLIDNIIITKTASPDLPGDWSGAYLSIETKDYPNELNVGVNVSFGYNDQATFRDNISSERSSTDWLGFDNGFRDITHPSDADFPLFNENPTNYDRFMAIGQKDYIESLGLNANHFETSNNKWLYERLVYVNLGLLAPGLIYDDAAGEQASRDFVSEYRDLSFALINEDVSTFSKSMANNWGTVQRTAPLNFSKSFTLGNRTEIGENTLGYVFGFRYSSSTKADPNSIYQRPLPKSELVINPATGNPTLLQDYTQEATSETNGWSALAKLAYKMGNNHSVSVIFMPNFTGTNQAQKAYGYKESTQASWTQWRQAQIYEERQQMVYQYKSTHFFPESKFKINVNASYTDGQSNTPDFKDLGYYQDSDSDFFFDNTDNSIRFFRGLNEQMLTARFSAELPIDEEPGLSRKIKFGASYTGNDRENSQYSYILWNNSASDQIVDGNFKQYFSNDNLEVRNGQLNMYYQRDNDVRNFSVGSSQITAGFGMLDYNFTPRVRLSGGLRVEHTNISTDLKDLLGLPIDHQLRDEAGAGELVANPGSINQFDYLPSANLIYKVSTRENQPVNLRMNYSRSLARPSLREATYLYMYDYSYRLHVLGNPELEMTKIDNYDLRFESFFPNADNAAISLFYKDFTNHIELIDTNGYVSWDNADESFVYGVELEGKKGIVEGLDFLVNVTLIKSQTIVNGQERSMFGQSPYIINGMLSYQNEKGWGAGLSYNVQGNKLAVVSRTAAPDVYELARHLLDLKISKNIGDHFSASIKARNILNAPQRRAYKYKEGFKVDFDRFTYGTTYSLSVSYKLK